MTYTQTPYCLHSDRSEGAVAIPGYVDGHEFCKSYFIRTEDGAGSTFFRSATVPGGVSRLDIDPPVLLLFLPHRGHTPTSGAGSTVSYWGMGFDSVTVN